MSTPREYCASLYYLHRSTTWHGLYFGDFSHGIRYDRLSRLDCVLITLQIILGGAFLYNAIAALTTDSFGPAALDKNGEMRDVFTLLGELKPGSRFVLKLGFALFFISRLSLQSVLIFKGLKIFETINNRYFQSFDHETRFDARFKLVSESMTFLLTSMQLASFWLAFGVFFDIGIIATYITARQANFTFLLQLFVYRASGFCLGRLHQQASSSSLSTNECLRCTRIVERILHLFTSFYRYISLIVLADFANFLAFCLFQGIYSLIREPPARMILLLKGGFTCKTITYLIIFYQHHRIKSGFMNLHSILSKKSSGLSVIRQAKQADLVVRVHLLGLDVDRETPPTLCGLLSFHHATIINITIFMVETSIVLYQTEYM